MMIITMVVAMMIITVVFGVVTCKRKETINNALYFLRREANKGSTNAELKILELEKSRSYKSAYWVLRDTSYYRANKFYNYK